MKPLKILMLHGYTQSGPLFHAKTRALEKNLRKAFPQGVTLHYPTAPIRLSRASIPTYDSDTTAISNTLDPAASESTAAAAEAEDSDAWGWWRRVGEREPYTYADLDVGLAHIAAVLRAESPFQGVIGFSQGAAAAAMVASLLEPGRRAAFAAGSGRGGMAYPESFAAGSFESVGAVHAPLRFAVSYSGFSAGGNPAYRAFYEPKIATPMLHFIGTLDTVVEEARSLQLVEACERSEGRVIYHPGGHFLPSSQKQYVGALVAFIREAMAGDADDDGSVKKDAADMEVPF